MTRRRRATEIGAKAHELLGTQDRRWSVLASVSGAIYIESEREEVLWIVGSRSALHGRAILILDMPSDRPSCGAPCDLAGGCLRIGDKLAIDLARAPVWPLGRATRSEGRVVEWSGRLADAIHELALQSSPRGGFAPLVIPVSSDGRLRTQETGAALAETTRRAIAALDRAASGSDLPESLEQAVGLVGLGEGLTPSGDDYLGAFLCTLRVLHAVSQPPARIDWRCVEAWVRRVRPWTNKISYAVLADHTRGETVAPLSALLHAALTGSHRTHLVRLAGQVAEIGHSSGWDMLAGVYCASSGARRTAASSSEPVISSYSGENRQGAVS